MRLSVFGAGSWGTALAHQMARRGHVVLLWAREPEVVEGINQTHRNPCHRCRDRNSCVHE